MKFIQLLSLTLVMFGALHAMDTSNASQPEQEEILDLGRQLRHAARDGKREVVEQLLQQNVPVDATNVFGVPPLRFAIMEEQMDICKLLIAHNAAIDTRDSDGYTHLMWAAYWDLKDMCELLIAHKASVNARNNHGGSALIGLIANTPFYKDICHLLIDTTINPFKANQTKAVILMGIKKFRKTSSLNPIDKHVVQLIAVLINQPGMQEFQSLYAQIHYLEHIFKKQELAQEFRAYVDQQLKLK